MVIIMRRFKTHSASSATANSSNNAASAAAAASPSSATTTRKSSSVSGLFKSASSPTPPTSFSISIAIPDQNINSSASFSSSSSPPSTAKIPSSKSANTTTTSGSGTSYHQRSSALFRNYGRALNRSLHSGIGYVSGHSNSNTSASSCDKSQENTSNNSQQNHPQIDDQNLLSVDSAAAAAAAASSGANLNVTSTNVNHQSPQSSSSSSKSPLSPKLPSRFKFSKNKSKSNSVSWYSSGKSREQIKQGASCPGLLESGHDCSGAGEHLAPSSSDTNVPSSSSTKPSNVDNSKTNNSNAKPSKLKNTKLSKHNRPLLMRQHSDEHQHALIERALQADSSSKPNSFGGAQSQQGSSSKKDPSNKHSNHKSSSANQLISFASVPAPSNKKSSSSSNKSKLRKMGALECSVPTDIVYEEGDNNKCIDNVHFNDLFHGTLNDSSSITMPHSIRNDPRLFKDDIDIRFSRTLNSCKLPQIRYASPDRLFERLTDLRFLSIDFLNTFLLTYRVFTDSIVVIEALKKVHYNPDMQLSSMSSALHDSSGSLDEVQGGSRPPGGNELTPSSAQTGTHLHPHQSPHHQPTGNNLLNIHATSSGSGSGGVAGVAAANEYLSTTIDYDYSRRVSTSSVLSDINELGGHRESIASTTDLPSNQQMMQAQQFNASNVVIRNSQHWRLSYRKFEEEQARERYLKRLNNRNMHGSISSATSASSGNMPGQSAPGSSGTTTTGNDNQTYILLAAGEPLPSNAILDPISVPIPPPPSPEVPGYFQKERKTTADYGKDSGGSSNDDESPIENQQQMDKDDLIESFNCNLKPGSSSEKLQVPVHSQSCDTLTSEQSNPTSPLSSATSSATLVGSDSKSGSPRPSPVSKSPPQNLPNNSNETTQNNTEHEIIQEEEGDDQTDIRSRSAFGNSIRQHNLMQNQLSEGTPPPTPPLPGTPKHSIQSNHASSGLPTPPISSVGSCFVLPTKSQQQQQQQSQQAGQSKSDSRSSSISQPMSGLAASGRLSATSTTLAMNYLRVRGAGNKRGSGSSESESMGSTSVTPRSSFQTDTTGISTPRSSFQHPDSPQMSSKAGVVVTSSRATSRRSSTASAASAFAVATAASSNPPEPTDPMMKQIPSRGNSRFPSATGADLKIPNAGGGASGQNSGTANAAAAAASAARCKRESMISTAATMRVLNVLRHWVSKHSQDFENDLKLLQITNEFLDELVHNTTLLPAEHKAAAQLQQMIAKQTMEAKEKIDLDVLLAPPMIASKDTIETLSALEIAEVMTYIDHNIFVRIQSEESLGQAWMKEDKNTKAFHILLMTKHFNDISRLVASEVLRVPEIPKRVSIIEKWAAVADICRCFHNFNGVLQICAAFTNSSVFRLKRTWEKVAKTTKQTIEKLQTLVSTDGRFRNMREALHRCDPPCIPYLGMYLTDLSFIEEGTPNFTDDGLLNFSKMRMIAHVIREIRHFQQTPYKIEHNPRVTNYLLDNSRHLQDEQLYQMSLCLEPRLSRLSTINTSMMHN